MELDWLAVLRYGGDIVLTAALGVLAFMVWQRGRKGVRRGRRPAPDSDRE